MNIIADSKFKTSIEESKLKSENIEKSIAILNEGKTLNTKLKDATLSKKEIAAVAWTLGVVA